MVSTFMQRNVLQIILVILAVTSTVKGHTVDQFYTELFTGEREFRMVVYADAAYCLPEFRGDEGKDAPSREWLIARSEVDHARLRVEAEKFLREIIGFTQDEAPIKYNIQFPDYDSDPYDFHKSPLSKAILRVELIGEYLPAGGSLQVWWNDPFEANLLVNIVKETVGGESNNFLQVDWLEGGNQMDLGVMIYPFEEEYETVVEVTERNNWFTFVKVGWDHIAGFESNFIPKGLDHILFVVGLFLFSPTWKPLLHQSLTFTVSHSLTLALSLLGIVVFEGKWVEVLIALSIVYIGVENLWARKVPKHRLVVVFFFGLLHGFGFGSVLQEFLPKERLLFPLIGFNLGVELGQVVILGICFLVCWKFLKKFDKIRLVGSSLIAIVAAYWVVERIIS